MSKTAYHISLKGYVGGYDFDRSTVDRELAKNEGKQVNVLIDSLGGSLATGLSISAAFKNHGNVNVHFVGLNASAATIASLGAAHISIDAGAMYLVHQCSMAFFEWGSLNSAQFETLIADCEKIKADLDKLDLNCAQLYAARCKRSSTKSLCSAKNTEDLLALMKVGGWLTAKEALDWGFVDEITDLADEPAPKLTDALASAMASEGMPIPNIPLAETDRESLFGKFLTAIASLFKPSTNPITTAMIKTYTFLSAILADKPLAVKDGAATVTVAQLDAIEDALAEKDRLCNEQKQTIADLQAKLDKTPAEPSKQVVEDNKPGAEPKPKNDVEQFVDTYNSAKALFAEV
jgi:putative endopeptidase Clp